MFKPKKQAVGPERAQELAIQALAYLAEDEDRLNAFLTGTGISPGDLREASGSPQFFSALLDHVTGDDALILGLAAAANTPPEQIAAAAQFFRKDEY